MNGSTLSMASDRFEIRECLGQGGMGVVYSAWDRERRMMVALKTLVHLTPEALVRFKAEFRTLQDVHHPNLVGLGELIHDRPRWFFTMELVSGVDFLKWVRPGNALNERRLRSALAQLCVGIDVIHAMDKVHCDIKPSNVLVTAEGRVVVLDFGLLSDRRTIDAAEATAGTPEYMAPEQLLGGGRIGPWSDWFAVGIVLHQALTGRHPFLDAAGGSGVTRKVAVRQASEKDVHPAEPELGELSELTTLCNGLLQADPTARPSGDEILRQLGRRRRERPARRIVGRDQEFAELAAAYERCRAGNFEAVIVDGPSGVGKTTLVRKFIDEIDRGDNGPLVLIGRCSARESVPFKAIDEPVDTIARHLRSLPVAERKPLLPSSAWLIARSFIGFADLVDSPARQEILPADPRVRRELMLSAVRELFANVAARWPIVLVIEDLQWADGDSRRALEVLLGSPARSLLLVCTLRTREGSEHELPFFMRTLNRLRLRGLSLEQGEELAALLLGGEANLDRRAIASQIAADSDGLPIFIDLLSGWARERGSHSLGSNSLDHALAARITSLPDAIRPLLDTVALAGDPISLRVAAAAAAIDGNALAQQIAALQSANLVRTTGVRLSDSIEIFHDRVRRALRWCLGNEEQRTRHALLAEALEASGVAAAESLFIHWRKAGELARASEHALRAADEAAAVLAFDRAARLYRHALRDHAFTEAKAQELRERRADALALAGRKKAAAIAYEDAAAHADPKNVVRLQQRAGEEFLKGSQIVEGVRIMNDLSGGDGGPPRSPERAALSIGWSLARLQIRGVKFRIRFEAELESEALDRVDRLMSMGRYLGFVDPAKGLALQLRALLLALKLGEPRRVGLLLASVTPFLSALGGRRIGQSDQYLKLTTELHRQFEDPYLGAMLSLCGGIVDFHKGHFLDARLKTSHAVALFESQGTETSWEVNASHAYRFSAMLRIGEVGAMVRELPAIMKAAQRRGDISSLNQLRHWPAEMAVLYADQPEEARAAARLATSWFDSKSIERPFSAWVDVLLNAHIDLYVSEAAAATARLDGAWPGLRKHRIIHFPMAHVDALELRARCALMLAIEQPENRSALLRRAERAAALIRKQHLHWADPLADLIDAGIALRTQNVEGAARIFERAASRFEHAGMRLHAAVARLRHGRCVGGAASDERCREAINALSELGVGNPERAASMLSPV